MPSMLTLANNPALSETALTAIAVKRAAEVLKGTKLLPEKKVPKAEFKYKVIENVVGYMAPSEVAEDAETPLTGQVGYTEKIETCREWRRGAIVSERAIREADKPLDPIADTLARLTGEITLRQEAEIVSTLTDTAVLPTNHVVTLAAGNEWSNPASDLAADILRAKRIIQQDSGITPDVLVIGPDTEEALLKHNQVFDTLKYVRPITEAGQLPALFGLNVFVLTASQFDEATNTWTDLLADKAIIMRSGVGPDGLATGHVFFSEPLTVRRKEEGVDWRGVKLTVFKTFKAVLEIPSRVYLIQNTIA